MSRYKVFEEPIKDRFASIMVKKELKEKLNDKMKEKNLKSLSELFQNWIENDGKKSK